MPRTRSYLSNVKTRIKADVTNKLLVTQEKRWARVIDAMSAIFCFISAAIALYILKTEPDGKLPNVSNLVVWAYLLTSLPMAYILFKESSLKKIERHAMVFFILASSISLLLSIMVTHFKI